MYSASRQSQADEISMVPETVITRMKSKLKGIIMLKAMGSSRRVAGESKKVGLKDLHVDQKTKITQDL